MVLPHMEPQSTSFVQPYCNGGGNVTKQAVHEGKYSLLRCLSGKPWPAKRVKLKEDLVLLIRPDSLTF